MDVAFTERSEAVAIQVLQLGFLYSVVRKTAPVHVLKKPTNICHLSLIKDLASCPEQSLIIIGLYNVLCEHLIHLSICGVSKSV